MAPHDPNQDNETAAEYLLFGAIVLMTGCGVVCYKAISENPQLESLSTVLALVYFGFLAWAFAQLNYIHRKRRSEQADDAIRERIKAERATVPVKKMPAQAAPPARREPVWGMTMVQLTIVIGVFMTAFSTFLWALSVYRRS